MSTRNKSDFDVLAKIEKERIKRGWSEYELAKNAQYPQSTINNWYRRDLEPTLFSIERVCNAFGITLSQFFKEEGSDERVLGPEETELIDLWAKASPHQRETLLGMLDAFIHNK